MLLIFLKMSGFLNFISIYRENWSVGSVLWKIKLVWPNLINEFINGNLSSYKCMDSNSTWVADVSPVKEEWVFNWMRFLLQTNKIRANKQWSLSVFKKDGWILNQLHCKFIFIRLIWFLKLLIWVHCFVDGWIRPSLSWNR